MSHTNIRMGGCSTGRSTQKYSSGGGGGADLSSILTAHGDMIYADSSVEAAKVSIGQTTGHVLTITGAGEVDWRAVSLSGGQVGNLQQVTTNDANTDVTVELSNLTTSLIASGNVLVSGVGSNVTASKFIGSGLELTGVALETDLTDNASRISNLETATIISNSSTITTGFTQGDIIYASADNVLNKLALGTTGQVLKSDGTDVVWGTGGSSLWSNSASGSGKIHYSLGNVGIGVADPQYLLDLPSTGTVKAGFFIGDGGGLSNLTSGSQWTGTNTVHFTGNVGIGTSDVSKTLSVGSNVSIDDTGADKLSVAGSVHIARNLKVIDEIDVYMLRANFVDIKNINVVAERPRKS